MSRSDKRRTVGTEIGQWLSETEDGGKGQAAKGLRAALWGQKSRVVTAAVLTQLYTNTVKHMPEEQEVYCTKITPQKS